MTTPLGFLERDAEFEAVTNVADAQRLARTLNLSTATKASATTQSQTFDYDTIQKYKFKSFTAPAIGTYVHTYINLANETMNCSKYTDMVMIALNLRIGSEPMLQVLTDPATGTFDAKARSVNDDITSWADGKVRINAEVPNADLASITQLTETNFRTYMEVFCFICLRLIYKDADMIAKKTDFITNGLKMLKIDYDGDSKYISIDRNMRDALRNHAENHLWRAEISVTLIENYAQFRIAKANNKVTFMAWALMLTTHLQNFGVARVVVGNTELLNITLKEYIVLITTNEIYPEVTKFYSVCNTILQEPSASDFKRWIYFKWCGMVSDNYFQDLRMPNFKFTSSLAIGVFNGALLEGAEAITYISFPPAMYERFYYLMGFCISHKGSHQPITHATEELRAKLGGVDPMDAIRGMRSNLDQQIDDDDEEEDGDDDNVDQFFE